MLLALTGGVAGWREAGHRARARADARRLYRVRYQRHELALHVAAEAKRHPEGPTIRAVVTARLALRECPAALDLAHRFTDDHPSPRCELCGTYKHIAHQDPTP